MDSFYSREELEALGLEHLGQDVKISRHCHIYSPQQIWVEDHVRIDDMCLLSGKIRLGHHVHVAAATLLYGGKAGISFGPYSTISSRCAVYALSDDYSGRHMTSPTLPEKYTGVIQAPVTIGRHCIIGTGCTILPGVDLAEGCAVGAMSLINRSTQPWGIYVGIPARRIKEREKELLALCELFEAEMA